MCKSSFQPPALLTIFVDLLLLETDLQEDITEAGTGVLQHGNGHVAVQPSVKRRVECGFLKPPCALGKVPFSSKYEENGVYFMPFLS